MRKLLWIGDAACDSGFAKATHHTLEVLRRTWDVSVLGINYRGDPHPYPYPIYPAYVPGGDLFGVRRTASVVRRVQPDLIVIQQDPWNFPAYLKELAQFRYPVVGAVAVDGLNCRGKDLNGLTRAIFWTKFGQEEAISGGMTIPSGVVPLGVDLDIFKPGDRLQARQDLGLPERCHKGFIVGNVNRNQPRKNLDLTIRYFAHWVLKYGIQDAFLYLHVCPTGEYHTPCEDAAAYYGINDSPDTTRLILVEPHVFRGAPESHVVRTLQSFDVQMTTSLGEGMGLPTLEGMACGIPQIGGKWSAYADWAKDGMVLVPCTATSMNPRGVVGGIPDEDVYIRMLDALYRNQIERGTMSRLGQRVAARPEYRWENIGQRFAEELDQAAPWLAV